MSNRRLRDPRVSRTKGHLGEKARKVQHARVIEAVDITPYLVALHTQRVHSIAWTVAESAVHPDAGYVELGSIL